MKSSEKIIIITALIGAAATISAAVISRLPVESRQDVALLKDELKTPLAASPASERSSRVEYRDATLSISGSGIHVRIVEGRDKAAYPGGTLSGAGGEAVVAIPKGQSLYIDVSGAGNKINITPSVLEYVMVSGGVGTKVATL